MKIYSKVKKIIERKIIIFLKLTDFIFLKGRFFLLVQEIIMKVMIYKDILRQVKLLIVFSYSMN